MDSTSIYGLIIIVALILLAFVIALIVKLNNKYKRSEEKRIEKERRGETRSGRLHYGDEYKTSIDYTDIPRLAWLKFHKIKTLRASYCGP